MKLNQAGASGILRPMQKQNKFNLIVKLAVVLAGIISLVACSVIPKPSRQSSVRPAQVVEPGATTPAAMATPLTQQQPATSPWDYIALSQKAAGAQKHAYLLDAIEGFLDLNQAATARTLLEQLENQPLTQNLFIRKQILLAQSFFLAQQYRKSEALLRPLSNAPGLEPKSAARLLLLRAQSLAALGNPESALRLLAGREPLLSTPDAQDENQDAIWRVLALLEPEHLETLRSDTGHPVLADWADLAILSQRFGWNPHGLKVQLEHWRQLHPAHPASNRLVPQTLHNLGNSITQYRKVALLLPLTSGFGSAAQAVYDGFAMMQEADSNPLKPQVVLYDTGDNAELVGFYYQAAVREGAELVVGPLGKIAVDSLVSGNDLSVPTLLLGNTDTVSGRRDVFQFGLSPEDEAREVARKAFEDGHRIAAALYPETDWGRRQLGAFSEQWFALGGTLAESSVYIPERQDHAQTIKLMLNVDESESRHRALEQFTGESLEFVAKRREDLDFIFLIARSRQGRQIKPQISFHKGQGIPVYAISQIYSGDMDKVKDLDLDGVEFGDMPWLLLDSGVNRFIRENLPRGNSYQNQSLDRLFGLGMDIYQLLFRLEQMKTNPLLVFKGATGRLNLAADGKISRRLEWARFVEGKPRPIGWEAAVSLTDTSAR